MLSLLLVALQAASAPPPPQPGTERFSILLSDPCPVSTGNAKDIVVCGRRQTDDRLPELPDTVPSGPTPSNPYMTGIGALRAGPSCAATQWGCMSQLDLKRPALLLANEARIGISKLVDKHRDRSNRVPITLDGPEPRGHLEP